VILADRGGVGRSLATELRARGERCVVVASSQAKGSVETDDVVDPGSVEDFERMLGTVGRPGGAPCRGVIHLWNLDMVGAEPTSTAMDAIETAGGISLVSLVKAMATTAEAIGSPRIWIITRGVQAAGPAAGTLAITQAPAWGFGRVIALEHPELWGGLVDLDPAAPADEALPLLGEVLDSDSEDQVAFRNGVRYVARLARSTASRDTAPPARFRAEASYLVTGGLGALGLRVARWMVEQGARRIILLGRTALPSRSRWSELEPDSGPARQVAAVQALEALGAKVWPAAVDVADESALADFLRELDRQSWPALRGIVHAAGIAEPQSILDMDVSALRAVLRPKVAGAWALHQLTRERELDFFVLFSSIASVGGSRDFAHYAAANHFLDALAHHRKRLGLPALSINWGPWDESGMATVGERRETFTRVGLAPLPPERALQALSALLGIDAPQRIVASVDWAIFKPIYEAWGPRSLLAGIDAGQARKPSTQDALLLLQIRDAPSEAERKERLTAYLRAQVEAVLGLAADDLDLHQPLNTVGLDSLMASQLKMQVEAALGITLPIVKFLQGPSVAELAGEMAGQLALRRPGEDAATPWKPIVPDPERRYAPFPMTDLQQAYWIGRSGPIELSVQSNGYVEFEIPDLDIERMSRAFRRAIDRHDMMRMIVRPDGLQQILKDVPPYQIELADLRGLDAQAVASHLDAVRRQMRERVSPADQWPLFEIQASLLDGGCGRLHIKTDLLLGEALSLATVINEIHDFYEQPDLELEPLDVSFRDYVLALEELKQHDSYQRSREYWLQRLATFPPGPDLPLSKPLAAARPPHYARRSGHLDAITWPRLKARAAQAGVTPSGLLLAAYAEVVANWNRSPRFTIVVLFGNRPPIHPQILKVLGQFNTPILLAVDSSGATFEARARAIQEQLWEDLNHGSFTGVGVMREMNRTLGGTTRPLNPVGFSSHLRWGGRAENFRSLPWTTTSTGLQVPQIYLDFNIVPFKAEGDELHFHMDAVDEVFPSGMHDEMFAACCGLLDRLADDEASWTGRARRLLPAAQALVRDAVNATEVPVPAGLLHAGFMEQAGARPQQPAVIAATRTLSYEELDRLSTRIAHRLRRLGARPNKLVGVVMEKGWEQVAAVIGILKSGAAYLPADPAWPTERLQRVLELGQVELALTQPALVEKLQWSEGVRPLALEEAEFADEDDQPLASVQTAEDVAYVLFTSGSTGIPKGVTIDHRGALNTVVDVNQRFSVGPEDCVLALSSLTFDLSVYDIFGVLAAGGTIVVPEAARALEPAHWAELAARHKVTIWNSVPAMMEMLVDYVGALHELMPRSLRLAMLSGDWVPVGLPERARRLKPDLAIVSLGGATEASIWSILYPIGEVDPRWTSIPYGKPMANQRMHVLNEALEPCPVWVQGQIHIGGIGLAKGYWQDEEKTRERFIIHPQTGERLYRTGDLGRYLPDGNIEFFGREDFQVKIRGFRIELGEIEAALRAHGSVREALVIVQEEGAGNRRLIAYVVPAEGQAVEPREMQDFVRQKLPEYMVPAAVVLLQALPLTANGKVDRAALPRPEQARVEAGETAPRTLEEAKLAGMFATVLAVPDVGIHDNFFELGGHSLLAARLVAQIREEFGKVLPLSVLFTLPTIAQLAEQLKEAPDAPEPVAEMAAAGRGDDALEVVL
jgi:amino acid adenylation domain-containing protein